MLGASALALALCVATVAAATGNHWAVLVAGSNQYYNYRHQADIYHAYHLLTNLGFKRDRIILMHYDDIAQNEQNPKKGSVINCVGCPDVYSGLPSDANVYRGEHVSADNFLKILRGEKTGVGNSLQSSEQDNIFVYFADHGGPGIISFPAGDSFLHAKDLIETLRFMKDNKKFNKLVFYMEACESGSMFDGLLPADWNIYAVTASDPSKSSYACDYDEERKTYLNDCWSRNFMNDTEANVKALNSYNSVGIYHIAYSYTLEQQFEAVKKLTKESPECRYGDLSIAKMALSDFIAGETGSATNANSFAERQPQLRVTKHRIPARHVKTDWLRRQLRQATTTLEKMRWTKHVQDHETLKMTYQMVFDSFSRQLGLPFIEKLVPDYALSQSGDNSNVAASLPFVPSDETDTCSSKKLFAMKKGSNMDYFSCMKSAVQAAEKQCGKFREESFVFTHLLAEACRNGISPQEQELRLRQICASVRQLPAQAAKFQT